MVVRTAKFGEIEVDEKDILTFNNGIFGFEKLKKYILISKENSKFYWLQAIDAPEISLACINPFDICNDYSSNFDDEILGEMEVFEDTEVTMLCVVVVPKDITKSTVNLMAPIIINRNTNIGMQVVLQGSEYSTRHSLFS